MTLPFKDMAFSDDLRPLSVTQLSVLLKNHIEKDFSAIILCGEISGYKQHSSGHHYFSLKDQDAVIDAICWKGTPLSVQISEGLNVICHGRVTTYSGRSKYQIIVQKMQYQGEGVLLAKLEELKKKLALEGIFSADLKKPLPAFPKKIGLITSATGAVIQDIFHRLEARMPTHVCFYPSAVQGPSAAQDVLTGLQYFLSMPFPPDVIIIARGGGSVEDLWPFNDEALVRAVAFSPIPIISAIGHETDTTLMDYAADVRAPTPTAAAEFAVRTKQEWEEKVTYCQMRLNAFLQNIYDRKLLDVTFLCGQLEKFRYRFESIEQRLDDFADRLTYGLIQLLKRYQESLDRLCISLDRHDPMKKFAAFIEEIQELGQQLSVKVYRFLTAAETLLDHYQRFLKELSHQRILEKGFTLVYNDRGSLIKSIDDVHLNDTVSLSFFKGCAQAKITQIEPS